MKRDFTSGTEEQILDYCGMHEENESWSPVDAFGSVAIEEYLINVEDINYCMDNIEVHHAMYMHDQAYNEEWVHKVFDDVRACDNNYAGKAGELKANGMDYYIASMKTLCDSIRVAPPGQTSVSVEQLMSYREEYGRYGSVGGVYSSIFGDSVGFNADILKAGDGAITPTFNRLYSDGRVDWELFDAWMVNGANGWEIAAISRLIDTYLTNSEPMNIDTNGYAELLSHCYIRNYYESPYMNVDFSWDSKDGTEEIPDYNNYDIYTISPVVVDLALYRQTQSYESLFRLAPGFSDTNTPGEDAKLKYDCFVSDSLIALCSCYPAIRKAENARGEKLLSVNMDYEMGAGTISVYNEYLDLTGIKETPEINIVLYDVSLFDGWSYVCNEADEAGKKDPDAAVYNSGVNALQSLLTKYSFKAGKQITGDMKWNEAKEYVDLASNTYSYGKTGIDAIGLYSIYDETVQSNNDIDEQIHMTNYKDYVISMGGTGTFFQCGDEIVLSNVVVDDRTLAMRLAYYNSENDADLTMEELKTQLNISSSSEEGIEELKAYSAFANDSLSTDNANKEYESCKVCCENILNLNGMLYNVATPEQIADAFNQAVIVEKYMIENGYGHYKDNSILGQSLIDEALEAYEGE